MAKTHDPEDSYFKPAEPEAPPTRKDSKSERPPDEAETGVHQPYPAHRYKFGEPVMQVENAEDDKALGAGWSKSPEALLPPPEPEPTPVTKARDTPKVTDKADTKGKE